MKVAFSNLYLQYKSLKKEIDLKIDEVIKKSAFSGGPYVEEFERHFAHINGSKYCLGVNSGTSALHLALWALGVGPGDEVIVPAFTFIATAEAVSLTGATPVFVDSEEITFNLDPQNLENFISQKTKAVILVHLYGQPAQVERINKICKTFSLYLVEDCAQAHLSYYKKRSVGNFGISGCFSFYPSKNLGAFGEAGAIITNNQKLYKKMLSLRNHGSTNKYYHDFIGHNYRMEGLQGAVLNIKLAHLRGWNDKRREIAHLYTKYLNDIKGLEIPKPQSEVIHTYHQFVVLTEKRRELQYFLKENGIETQIHYPLPCHLQKAYKYLNYKRGSFPIAEMLSKKVLSLPMYPELTKDEVMFTAKKIREFYSL